MGNLNLFGSSYTGSRSPFTNTSFVKNHSSSVTKVWTLLPKRCAVTNKIMWLKPAYKVEHRVTWLSPPTIVVETRWFDPGEYLKLLIRTTE